MPRVRLSAALALLVASVCAGTASSGERPTAVHSFVAFKAGKLAPGLTVSASVRGYCWSTSGVESRSYAWRCLRGNTIHDPCFSATPRSNSVVCPERPWSKRVRLLRLTRPLPRWKLYKSRQDFPWGIWATTGKRCFSLAATATGEVAGKRHTYDCVDGGVLAGFAHRRKATWTIYYAPSWRSKRVTLVGITNAWW
jgi:hypothetical protein